MYVRWCVRCTIYIEITNKCRIFVGILVLCWAWQNNCMERYYVNLPRSLFLSLCLSLSFSLALYQYIIIQESFNTLFHTLTYPPSSLLDSSSRSSRAPLILAVTLLNWLELSTLRSVSVPGASTTTWMMWGRTLTITPSLRCLETGALETSLRYVRMYVCM